MKQKKDSSRTTTIVFEFVYIALIVAQSIEYIYKNPSIQSTALLLVLVGLGLTCIIVAWLDVIEEHLFNIRQSLDDAYDIKQISELRSTMDRRHLEKLSAEIKKILEEKTDEESRD